MSYQDKLYFKMGNESFHQSHLAVWNGTVANVRGLDGQLRSRMITNPDSPSTLMFLRGSDYEVCHSLYNEWIYMSVWGDNLNYAYLGRDVENILRG